MSSDFETFKKTVLAAAMKCAESGKGFSQEKCVLDEVARGFGGTMHTVLDIELQIF